MGFSLITIFEICQYVCQILWAKITCTLKRKNRATSNGGSSKRNGNPCGMQCLQKNNANEQSNEALKCDNQQALEVPECEEDIDLVERLT